MSRETGVVFPFNFGDTFGQANKILGGGLIKVLGTGEIQRQAQGSMALGHANPAAQREAIRGESGDT